MRKVRGAEWLGVHVRIVALPIDLARLDLSQCDLLLDIIEYHQEVFALLRVSGVDVGHGDSCAVVLHVDCWELEGYL